MRKMLSCLLLCLVLAAASQGLAATGHYTLELSGPWPGVATEPIALLSSTPRAVEGLEAAEASFAPLLPHTTLSDASIGALGADVTTLWSGEVSLSAEGTFTGKLNLTGELAPGDDSGTPGEALGRLSPATAQGGSIQSLTWLSTLPQGGHSYLLARMQTLSLTALPGAPALSLIGTNAGEPTNLVLDEGSHLRLSNATLSTGALSALSLSYGARLDITARPTEEMSYALRMPQVFAVGESAGVSLTLERSTAGNLPEGHGAMLLPSGESSLVLASGARFTLLSGEGRGLMPAPDGLGGALSITCDQLEIRTKTGTPLRLTNGGTPFTLRLSYDDQGRVETVSATGYRGTLSKNLNLSLADITELTTSMTPRPDPLPTPSPRPLPTPTATNDNRFNGWSITVRHVYQVGGATLLIPQANNGSIEWAAKSGDTVYIQPHGFAGFTPASNENAIKNVRKHMTYDLYYVRATADQVATVAVDPNSTSDIQGLRQKAQGTLRLLMDGGVYQELPYAMPANANEVTLHFGAYYTHTPEGQVLPHGFTMPTVPQGLTLSQQGNRFVLSEGTTPPPPTPIPQVGVNIAYRTTSDGGTTYTVPIDASVIGSNPITAQVAWGADLTDASVIPQPALAGYTFARADGSTSALGGETVTLCYNPDTVTVNIAYQTTVSVGGGYDTPIPASVIGSNPATAPIAWGTDPAVGITPPSLGAGYTYASTQGPSAAYINGETVTLCYSRETVPVTVSAGSISAPVHDRIAGTLTLADAEGTHTFPVNGLSGGSAQVGQAFAYTLDGTANGVTSLSFAPNSGVRVSTQGVDPASRSLTLKADYCMITIYLMDEEGNDINPVPQNNITYGGDFSFSAPNLGGYLLLSPIPAVINPVTQDETVTFTYRNLNLTRNVNITIQLSEPLGAAETCTITVTDPVTGITAPGTNAPISAGESSATATFNDVRVYDTLGNPNALNFSALSLNGYTGSVSGSIAGGYTITFTKN